MTQKDVKEETHEFNGKRKKVFRVSINPEEYFDCYKHSFSKYSSHLSGFKEENILAGFCKPVKVSLKNSNNKDRVGNLGEMAFGKKFNLKPDFSYKECGDNFDFKLRNFTIDVKTSSRKPGYDYGLVMAYANEESRQRNLKLTPKCNILVFGYLDMEDTKMGEAEVVLIGWASKESIIKHEIKRGKVGTHFNYEVPFSSLYDLDCLSIFTYEAPVYNKHIYLTGKTSVKSRKPVFT